jgi:hypothetical protein
MNVSEILTLLEAERVVRHAIIMLNRAFDDENWQAVRACLSENFTVGSAVVNQSGQQDVIRGADMMLTVMKDIAAQRQAVGTRSMHILGEIAVSVRADEAEGSTFQIAYLYRSGEVCSPPSKSGSRGTYRLRRELGAWKIVSFTVDRLWLEGEPY